MLPLSVASGLSWQSFRQTIAQRYTDVAVLSIAATGLDMSFSSDTGMAECLIVARKTDPTQQNRIHFTSLHRRPQSFAHAAALASGLTRSEPIRQIEDGPYGGTAVMVGDEGAGEMLTAPCQTDGQAWSAVRLADYSLAQTAYALAYSQLWLPGRGENFPPLLLH